MYLRGLLRKVRTVGGRTHTYGVQVHVRSVRRRVGVLVVEQQARGAMTSDSNLSKLSHTGN